MGRSRRRSSNKQQTEVPESQKNDETSGQQLPLSIAQKKQDNFVSLPQKSEACLVARPPSITRLSSSQLDKENVSPAKRRKMPTGGAKHAQECVICAHSGSGDNYGAHTCDSCKGFFKRTIKRELVYTCHNDRGCILNQRRQNLCPFCRYQKCLFVGMKRECPKKGTLNHKIAVAHQINQIATWAMTCREFSDINLQDRLALFLDTWNDLVILSLAYQSMGAVDELILSNGARVTSRNMEDYDLENIFHGIGQIAHEMHKHKISDFEYNKLRQLTLLNAAAKNLICREHVDIMCENILTFYNPPKDSETPNDSITVADPELPELAGLAKLSMFLLLLPRVRAMAVKSKSYRLFLGLWHKQQNPEKLSVENYMRKLITKEIEDDELMYQVIGDETMETEGETIDNPIIPEESEIEDKDTVPKIDQDAVFTT